MKVAKIPYLNAAPFYAGWGEDPPFESVSMVPRELGVAARNGAIDAGLMAVADWFRVDGLFDLIEPALGVAASERVKSVMLFSHDPPRRLDGCRVVVTRESSTSRRLAQLLAVAYWEAEIEWIPEDELEGDPAEEADGLLLIGDRALALMAEEDHGGWTRPIDLAAEWWTWQALPFVFAAWTVRSALPRRERERFGGFLSGSLALGSERLGEIAEAHAGPLGDAESLKAYLEHITYRLGTEEFEGMRRFRDLLAEHDIQEYEDARA
ncbi:MAG TPA: menaquinone biosynthesis protein [Gemmatimonadota bacterium]|nr:menaquinone biosynthesis protein [Gemmatimonadota bacterium]